MKEKKINNIAFHIAMVVFTSYQFFTWAVVAFGVFFTIATITNSQWALESYNQIASNGGISIGPLALYFDEIPLLQSSISLLFLAIKTTIIYSISSISLFLVTKFLRQLYKFKLDANTQSPFTNETINLLKRIGSLIIYMSVLDFILLIIFEFISDFAIGEVNLNVGAIGLGVLVLALAKVFDHGKVLQDDIDGLI